MSERGGGPICHKCGAEIADYAGGFIGRADLVGKPDFLFVVYCQACGEQSNSQAQKSGAQKLAPLSKTREPFRRPRAPRVRGAAG